MVLNIWISVGLGRGLRSNQNTSFSNQIVPVFLTMLTLRIVYTQCDTQITWICAHVHIYTCEFTIFGIDLWNNFWKSFCKNWKSVTSQVFNSCLYLDIPIFKDKETEDSFEETVSNYHELCDKWNTKEQFNRPRYADTEKTICRTVILIYFINFHLYMVLIKHDIRLCFGFIVIPRDILW